MFGEMAPVATTNRQPNDGFVVVPKTAQSLAHKVQQGDKWIKGCVWFQGWVSQDDKKAIFPIWLATQKNRPWVLLTCQTGQ